MKERTLAALPTLVTLGNAFCGLLAITYCFEALHAHGVAAGLEALVGDSMPDGTAQPGAIDAKIEAARADAHGFVERAVLVLLLAMVFDFFDGKVARLTHSESQFGVQIDSLCDCLSFGLVPAVLFKLVAHYEFGMAPKTALLLASFYLCGAVLRLARFNVEADLENDDHRCFRGLPSPAAAAGVASLVYVYSTGEHAWASDGIRWAFPWIVAALGVLMWTRLPYVHLANVLLTERRHMSHLLMIIVALGVLYREPALGVAFMMLGYALSGPVLYLWNLCTGRSTVEGESLI